MEYFTLRILPSADELKPLYLLIGLNEIHTVITDYTFSKLLQLNKCNTCKYFANNTAVSQKKFRGSSHFVLQSSCDYSCVVSTAMTKSFLSIVADRFRLYGRHIIKLLLKYVTPQRGIQRNQNTASIWSQCYLWLAARTMVENRTALAQTPYLSSGLLTKAFP